MFGAFARYGVATVGIPKPGIKFPMHLMTALFIGGYTCEYLALGQYHVAHDQAEIAAAKACYAKHGGGGGHH